LNIEELKIKSRKDGFPVLGLIISLFIHFFIFLLSGFFVSFLYEAPRSASIMLELQQFESDENSNKVVNEESTTETKDKIMEEEPLVEKQKEKESSLVYYSLNPSEADTSLLNQTYSEPTRNVRIKYPAGWTFMDQNVKGELDAVTFWSTSKKYDAPPYVFLEVKEKYLFNPKRFTDTLQTKYYKAYYNQPEELAGQVSQVFYFRTEEKEDFSLKLIVNGRENFMMFQKEFFGMIKTFKFGSQLF